MSLLFNMLSRLVMDFLPGRASFNFMAAVTICRDFGAQENKICHCFHPFPIYLPWSDGEKVGLKLNIQKTKIMACGPITSWQIDGETMETVTDVIFWGFKITADGDCSHEIKRHLLMEGKL